ncbi:hypothetical protein SAY87_022022 [Trapa incisa]|uniref:C2H2-type domain-containing protein n=1 Tax=Trapa incisa TaxID=236973 RepID=A0AAN7JU91_9MYRT|nr:hypothetical protein SAY87_022022 [Trapa incisa]
MDLDCISSSDSSVSKECKRSPNAAPSLVLLDEGCCSSEVCDNDEEEEKRSSMRPKVFTCRFCQVEFSSSQALGGHQNAHRQERALSKQPRGPQPNPMMHSPPFSYLSSALAEHQIASLYGSLGRPRVGVRYPYPLTLAGYLVGSLQQWGGNPPPVHFTRPATTAVQVHGGGPRLELGLGLARVPSPPGENSNSRAMVEENRQTVCGIRP